MEFCMRKRRRTYRLADIAAAIFASLLLAVDLMVRDPQPATTSVAQQGDPALVITLIFMALGLCVTFYGLYHERHVLRAHVMRRLEVRLRFVRRGVNYNPGLRRLVRLQLSLSHAAR
jgi:hypothetical protein